jgi:alkanesulfonate monooxygenase SsuD/methylene tetrahydromethanopterin reductase-like flavin-dependent oxidoreductase (luciferase family)
LSRLLIVPGLSTVIGNTDAEARERCDRLHASMQPVRRPLNRSTTFHFP